MLDHLDYYLNGKDYASTAVMAAFAGMYKNVLYLW
jgi:hypothetical protein